MDNAIRDDALPQPSTVPGGAPTTADLLLLVGTVHSEAGRARAELERRGYRAFLAGSRADVAAVIEATRPAVVVIDMDLADTSAPELCQQLKRDVGTRLIPLVLLCDPRDRQARLAGLTSGADTVLNKPVDFDELLARIRHSVRTSQYTNDLESAASIIMTLTAMLEARESSPGHCYRMANYAMALGRAVTLHDADAQALYRGAFLHDIGMLAIPDAILRKGGRLEPDEYEVIKSHPVIGDALCANLRTLHPVRPIVRHHHERLDGTGYPDGLKGDEIPLLAQIVGIVDVFEAITMGRAYERPRSAEDALSALMDEVDHGWRRRDLVVAFAGLVRAGVLDAAPRRDVYDLSAARAREHRPWVGADHAEYDLGRERVER